MVFSEPEEITRAKTLFQDGKVTEALQLVDDLEGKKGISQNERIACYIVKSSLYERMGEKEEFLQYVKKITQASQGLKKSLLLVDAYIEMARAYVWYTKEREPDYEKSLNLIVKCEELIENFTHISQVELAKRRIVISWMKALIFDERGEIDRALKFAENSLTLAKKLDHKVDMIWALGVIGQIYHNNGDLNLALRAYEQGLEISEKIDYKMMIESCHNGIGLIYSSQGELDQGINHLEQALVIAKEINYEFGIAACHLNLGLLYQQQGNYDRAQEFLKKSFKIFKSIGSPGYTSLDSLFHLALEKGDLEGAQNYLDQLKQLNEKLSSKDINIIYRIDHAVFLKMSPRSLNRGKAEEILKEIVDGEVINYDAHLIALLNLCDLLLSELSNTGILEIIEELHSYIAKLLNVAEKNHSFLILAEAYFLQARLSLLMYDLKETRQSLIKAQDIAEKYGLSRLAVKISNEHDEFLKQQNMWEDLKQSDAGINERIELSGLNQQMNSMIHRKEIEFPRVTDEDPVVIFIFSESGEPIFSQSFTDKWSFEDHLFGGFLSAINSFSDEMFSEGFDRAIFGQHTILIVPISPFLVCYLFKGQSYLAQHRLKHFAKILQANKKIWDTLQKFDRASQVVQSKDIPSLDPLITEIFINKELPELN